MRHGTTVLAFGMLAVVLSLGVFGRQMRASASPKANSLLHLPPPTDWRGASGVAALEVFVYPAAQPDFGVKVLWSPGPARASLTDWCSTHDTSLNDFVTELEPGKIRVLTVAAAEGFGSWPAGSVLNVALYSSTNGAAAWVPLEQLDTRNLILTEVADLEFAWSSD